MTFENILEKYGLSTFSLKVFAIITMVIDHVGVVFFPQHQILRIVGRLSFPIITFLIVQGYIHTSNVKKYALRLLIFAVISEIPFDLAIFGNINTERQNVYFTLLLGLVVLYAVDRLDKIWSMIVFAAACILAVVCHTDYNMFGILLILMLYLVRGNKLWEAISIAAANCGLYTGTQRYAAFALIPIAMYNGKKGPSLKYFFYAFYPLHLLIFYIIKYYII